MKQRKGGKLLPQVQLLDLLLLETVETQNYVSMSMSMSTMANLNRRTMENNVENLVILIHGH